MNFRRGLRAPAVLLCVVVLIQLFAPQTDAQRPKSPWQTLTGDAPLVIARGGFSGLFPDSSLDAYKFAIKTSLPGAVLWCDVQLIKDGVGICFRNFTMSNSSTIEGVYPNRPQFHPVNGVPTPGWFTIDFSLRDLKNVSLIRGIFSRSERFDGNGYAILTVQTVATELKPKGFWLNVQHDAFYAEHNLSMSSFLISASRTVSIDYISSPEVNFFRKIAGRFGRNGPSFVFQFLGKDDFEPTTKQTYRVILTDLAFVKTFASGILVPKSYILPLDDKSYIMLILEMLGVRNKEIVDQNSASNASSMYFPDWIYKDLEKGDSGGYMENGISSEEEEITKKMTLVGLWCVQSSPSIRPTMNGVVEMMEGNLDALEVPPKSVLQQIHVAPLSTSFEISEESSSAPRYFLCSTNRCEGHTLEERF